MSETGSSVRSTHRQPHDAIVTSLRILGLWVIENDSKPIREGLYKIYNKLIIINVCVFAIAVLADLCLNYDDLIIFTNDGCILSGISVIIFKIFNFQIRWKRIRDISEEIHTPVDVLDRSSGPFDYVHTVIQKFFRILSSSSMLYSTSLSIHEKGSKKISFQDPGVRAIVQACSFYEKLLLNSFWVIGGILSIALMFVPVEEGELPIRAQYPFDAKAYPMHQVAFYLQAWTVIVGLISINSMDRMIIGLCNWINVQLVVLASNYENCEQSKGLPELTNNEITDFIIFNDEDARVISDNDTFLMRYKTCIKNHQRIVNVIDELNQVFSSSLFVQLFTSFSMICLAGFQTVLGANNLSSLIKFSVYLGAASFQLVNWCWVGNALLHQSVSLSTSQWLSGWEGYLMPEVTHLMIVSMTQSNKSLGLQAGKFFTVSMQTFIAIIRNCYSFFAILTEMNGTD